VLKQVTQKIIDLLKSDSQLGIPEERTRIIGDVAGNREKDLDRRVNEIQRVSRVVQHAR
jgi:hypothetical protein